MALTTLTFQPLPLLSKHVLFLNPIGDAMITSPRSFNLSSKAHSFNTSFPPSHKIHIQNIVICARKHKKPSGSQKLNKILPKVISLMVSGLEILPEPLNLVIREFYSGDGGSSDLRFLKGLRGGNLVRWRRKVKRKLGILGFLVVSGLMVLVLFGSGFKSPVYYGVLALGFLAVLINGCKIRVKNWVLGICFLGGLMSLGFKREDMQKWVERIRASSPVLEVVKTKRRRNGRRVL